MPDPLPLDPGPLVLAAERLIAGRRTIHRFDPARPVPPDLLRRAVALATRAPNHKHTEPWRFVALTGATREQLVDLNADLVRAKSGDAAADDKRARWNEVPAYLVATCRRSDDAVREREDRDACAAALQNLALALWAEGVGAKWTTGPATRERGGAPTCQLIV